jgi:hypothetical protein
MELLSGGGIGGKTYNPPALEHYDIACLLFHNSSIDDAVLDSSHGRLVRRKVAVFAAPDVSDLGWARLAAFVRVERSGIREGKYFHRQSWYILSQVLPAVRAAQLIRGHRGTIENRLH